MKPFTGIFVDLMNPTLQAMGLWVCWSKELPLWDHRSLHSLLIVGETFHSRAVGRSPPDLPRQAHENRLQHRADSPKPWLVAPENGDRCRYPGSSFSCLHRSQVLNVCWWWNQAADALLSRYLDNQGWGFLWIFKNLMAGFIYHQTTVVGPWYLFRGNEINQGGWRRRSP